jgi:glucose/arabinose dehydrogenase
MLTPHRRKRLLAIVIVLLVLSLLAVRYGPRAWQIYHHEGLRIVTVAEGLDTPWSLAFLPDGRMLVTERPGRMRIIERDGRLGPPLRGLPPVQAQGEGGLMAIALDPQFATNRLVYWSYSEPAAEGAGAASTAVARARLEDSQLVDVQVVFRQPEKTNDARHFGSRLLFAADGTLFIGLGDRSRRDDAQRLDSLHGKIVRIAPDGSIPPDNPFVGTTGAQPAVWSFGHRNVQGLAVNPGTGELWASEHGPWGGDEINLVRRGHNYGWPVVTHGCEYRSCQPIGRGSDAAGMDAPIAWWPERNSTPPTAMTFLTSDRYPGWRGQLFVATLLYDQALMRIELSGHDVRKIEPLHLGRYGRARDVRQGPDGWLYVVVNMPDGRVVRLER